MHGTTVSSEVIIGTGRRGKYKVKIKGTCSSYKKGCPQVKPSYMNATCRSHAVTDKNTLGDCAGRQAGQREAERNCR